MSRRGEKFIFFYGKIIAGLRNVAEIDRPQFYFCKLKNYLLKCK